MPSRLPNVRRGEYVQFGGSTLRAAGGKLGLAPFRPHSLLTRAGRSLTLRPIMLGKSGRLIAGLAVLAVVAALSPAAEYGLGPTPRQGVLLLRNGEVIEGKISLVGELYNVALPGGEIRIKTAEVEFWCRDIQEVYRRKRAAIPQGDVRDHLRLARWCLHHDLLGCAGRELADALAADPSHPMIDLLQRRLKMAAEPPPPAHSVGYIHIPPMGTPGTPTEQAPSFEELDRLVRDLPPRSVESFTQTIQPLLLNHCATGGCHGPRSPSEFRLLRIPPGRPPSRRLTQRNLHAALSWVDRENPSASRLLTAPMGRHGTAKQAVFGKGQATQYQRLVDWVGQLSGRPAAKVPETVALKEDPPVRAMLAELRDLDAAAAEILGPPDGPPAAGFDLDQLQRFVPPSSVKRGAPLPLFVPVDPFDPEIFNRRFFPKRSPEKGNTGG